MAVVDQIPEDEGDWLAIARVRMIDNLKVALANEKQKNVNDRKMYEMRVGNIKKQFNQKLQEYRVSYRVATKCHLSQSGQSDQTSNVSLIEKSVQTGVIDENSEVDSSEVTAIDALQAEVEQLKRKVAGLVFENNRYHLSISNCTVCTSDNEFSDASSHDGVSIKASTPMSTSLGTLEPSISPVLCSSVSSSSPSSSSPVPALIPGSVLKGKQTNTVAKRKDKTFINRMVKTLAKLEAKYQVPEHKRKKRLFSRKQRTNPIVPKELASIYHVLAAPEPEAVAVPDPFPHVRWSDVRFKPALPNPELCPVHSCSQDPEFYQEKWEYRNGSVIPTITEPDFLRKDRDPFGTMPGYKTSLGVVSVPTTPVGGYVYCPDVKKWVLYAEPSSSPSAGRGTRRGGTPPARRRKG